MQGVEAGATVKLRSAHGEIERVVLAVTDDVVVISSKEEVAAAERQGRRPLCVGFRMHDVVEVTARARKEAR